MPVSGAYIAGVVELILVAAGAVLLWRFVLSPAARAYRPPPPLAAWDLTVGQFVLFLLAVVFGSMAAAIAADSAARRFGVVGDSVTVVVGAASQLGMLAGIGYFCLRTRCSLFPTPPRDGPHFALSGAIAFLVALPVLIATAKAWEIFLNLSGLPVDRQDLIGIFAAADSTWMVAAMITLAVAVAPITEELVFRAGLYRYLRTRIPRSIALLGPAIFFAALHVNWDTLRGLSSLAPLVVLAVVFSLAYERTGHIGTPMVAHALFNLNTVALILSGVTV